MKIYILSGKAGSGKNTLGSYLKECLEENNYKPCLLSITEPLYSYARNHFGWNGDQANKPREFLQKMGIEIIKEKLGKKTFLLDRLTEDIEILSEFFDTFIIVDARLKEEFEYLENKYNDVVTIQVVRENYDNSLTEEEKNHITETDLNNYISFDYIVKNKSLESLKKEAQKIIFAEEEL